MAIPNEEISIHHIGDAQEDIAMGMRAEDFAHLASIYTNLYSRPIEALLREYATNAWDSHVFAGNTAPIEVTLPTSVNPELVIQDYGLGLSLDEIRETYAMYGASTKRGTNAVAGQLGVGCKSGLAYADGFAITSVKDGVKILAMSTKDEHGVGVIKILSEVETDEPNGVRIAIPVDLSDVRSFHSYAQNLYQFWSPGTILVDGVQPEVPKWMETALALDDDTFLVRKDAGLHSSYVIMGNVPYPVDDATVGRSTYRFVARINIGDVDFAPSREDVRHTRHTDLTLARLHEFIEFMFSRSLDKALKSASSRWEETMLQALWQNKPLKFVAPKDTPIWNFDPSAYRRKASTTNVYSVSNAASTNTVIVTGFGAKNLSPTARERLTEACGSCYTFVILPTGVTGTSRLEGRPNVYAWSDIVAVTTASPTAKASRGPKVETRYKVEGAYDVNGSRIYSMTAKELADVTDKAILYVDPNERLPYGDLGAIVVRLYSVAQIARLERFVPQIAHYSQEVARQTKAACDAITEQDRQIKAARSLPTVFASLPADEINDPELADHIRLNRMADTATMEQAERFGVTITSKPLPDYSNRYPLANGGNYSDADVKAERVFYINARHQANKASSLIAAFSHGAAA